MDTIVCMSKGSSFKEQVFLIFFARNPNLQMYIQIVCEVIKYLKKQQNANNKILDFHAFFEYLL